jgi:nucleoside 2-deoxyribosyltransferase
MKIFIATSFSSKVDYSTGEVNPEFKNWLEDNILSLVKGAGYDYFCAVEKEGWRVNNEDPAGAVTDDFNNLRSCDALLVVLDEEVSPGLQIEIGIALERKMPIILAHKKDTKLKWSNQALIDAGFAKELLIPFSERELESLISNSEL